MKHKDELGEYLQIALSVLDDEVLVQPHIRFVPIELRYAAILNSVLGGDTLGRSEVERAKRIARFVLDRYRLSSQRIALRFVETDDFAGQVGWRGETWYIDLSRRIRRTDAELVAVLAHEVAHVVLARCSVRLEPELRNERLTDAVAVLAGFGPVMLRAYDRVRIRYYVVAFSYSRTRMGYLQRRDIRELNKRRSSLQLYGVKKLHRVELDSLLVRCPGCGRQLKLPKLESRLKVRCPVCGQVQMINLQPHR